MCTPRWSPWGPGDAEAVPENTPPNPTQAPVHVYPEVLALGEQPRESRAARLGHKVRGSPALAAGPSGQLETPEHPGLSVGRGTGHLKPTHSCLGLIHSPEWAGERIAEGKGNPLWAQTCLLFRQEHMGFKHFTLGSSHRSTDNSQEFCELGVKHAIIQHEIV